LAALIVALVTVASPAVICGKVSISVKDGVRAIESDGMPDHEIGKFPNDHNPNTASTKRYNFKMPADPKPADTTTTVGMWPFGVAIDGVPFDPLAAEWWKHDPRSGWQFEPMAGLMDLGLDKSNAHVQPDGAYHYHGVPTILIKSTTAPVLVGYAADGFPMYSPYAYKDAKDSSSSVVKLKSSYRIKTGKRPANGPGGEYDGRFIQDYEYVAGLGDLDESNGRTGVTPEYPKGTYYYVVTDTFPYVPRIFQGKPDTSFLRRPPPFGFRGGRGGMPPPGGRGGFGPMASNDPSQPGQQSGGRRGNRMGPPPAMQDGDGEHMGPPPGAPGENGQELMGPPPLDEDGKPVGPPTGKNAKTTETRNRRQMRGMRGPAGSDQMQQGSSDSQQGDSDEPHQNRRMHRRVPPPPNEDGDQQGRPPRPDGEEGNMPPPPPDDAILNALFGSDGDSRPPPPRSTPGVKKSSGKSQKAQY
jgi:hypothetical protein